jgi:hypothetical protein
MLVGAFLPEVVSMQQIRVGPFVLGLAAAVILAVAGAPAGAQVKEGTQVKDKDKGTKDAKDTKARQVEILTVDQVELKGTFYPSSKGKDAPCVLMLHALGENENSSNKEWVNLAKTLQEKGYAVLTFDFRGHGDSTNVKPGMPNKNPMLSVRGFWDEPFNAKYVKGLMANKPRPTEIKFKDFNTAYYTFLCNDIAAAKAFLDEKNDNGECNSGNIIFIGAKDGALLGALWLNSEWQRYKLLPPGPGMPQGGIDRQNPEGQAVTAAVWLSSGDTFGKTKNHYGFAKMLEIPAKIYKVPMLFLYGADDDTGKKLANGAETYIRGKNAKEYPYTAAMKVTGEGGGGRELLLDARDGTKQVLDFLDSAVSKTVPVKMRAKSEDPYVWFWTASNGAAQQLVAKRKGQSLVEFNGYNGFLK